MNNICTPYECRYRCKIYMNIITCFERETELQEDWQMKQKFSLVAI